MLAKLLKARMFALIALMLVCFASQSKALTRDDLITAIQSRNYDRNEPPPPKGEPTYVQVGLYVNSLAMDRQKETLQWIFYLRQSWNDTRLTSLFTDAKESINMGQGQWQTIWYPDLFFRNSIEVVHDDRPAEQTLLRIEQKGLWLVHKFKLTTSCHGLHRIGEVKKCSIMIESFKYTMDDIVLTWLSSPFDLDSDITLPGYKLQGSELLNCSQNYTAGAFPCAEIQLSLVDISHSLIVSAPRLCFAVGILLVVISWMSFWIDGDKILERMGLLTGVAVILILLLIGINVTEELDLPSNRHVITLGCLVLFVVAAMLEYAFAYCLLQWIPAKIKAIRKGVAEESPSSARTSRIIDMACGLVVFPVLFVIFLIFIHAVDM